MSVIKVAFTTLAVVIIAACNTSKKSSTSAAVTTPMAVPTATASPTPTSTAGLFMVSKSPDGIYPPGNKELAAIQAQYKDVTLEQLKKGHTIYTFGDCARCHRAQSIYKYDEAKWKEIIDRMAVKAQMAEPDKDAVYKYVLSIKAVQPK